MRFCVAERRGLIGKYANVLIVAGCPATVADQADFVVAGLAAFIVGGPAAFAVRGLSFCHLNGLAASAMV